MKDAFYDQLQQVIQEVPSHDVLCVIGDFNGRVGNDNEDRNKIVGSNGCGNINDNGHRLCDLCKANNLVIGSVPAQRDSQNDTDILRWQDTHPDTSTASGRTHS